MGIGDQEFREAMRCWATGVTVVTARRGDIQHGMTVSSFTSVSTAPAQVLVCLERGTRTRSLALEAGAFGVTVLGAAQQEISDRFAGRIHDTLDRFAGLDLFTIETGAPFLGGALAWLDCRLAGVHEAATHSILFGDVLDVRVNLQASGPLLYYNRAYQFLA